MMRWTLAGGLQGVYIDGGNDPSLRRRASLRSSEVGLYFIEFGSEYNKSICYSLTLNEARIGCMVWARIYTRSSSPLTQASLEWGPGLSMIYMLAFIDHGDIKDLMNWHYTMEPIISYQCNSRNWTWNNIDTTNVVKSTYSSLNVTSFLLNGNTFGWWLYIYIHQFKNINHDR
jgi:hypothetical protein